MSEMTAAHPVVPYDQGLIDSIASQMDLREPNREALEAVARQFDLSNGEPFEAVCDLATAVGKTYLAGALIEYLAGQGVRNFLIVAPGTTILNKTKSNFTDGHPKSVMGGMDTELYVVTIENFNTGATSAALADENVSKLFIFTVQSMLKPDKSSRKMHKTQEWLGEDLYQYLRQADDLVVLSDEHHVYAERAKAFSAAVRDLDAMGLVGLTATPAKSDEDKIIFHYPLARAIADRLVKTPVLVGRKDGASDTETQLRDGLALLKAKQEAADAYAVATGAKKINAVMFVVAGTIDDANAISEILRRPGMFDKDYEQAVLTIHSEAPDDALARLELVEEPDSKVRVIVSVSMLKEGWDVRNIFVICSRRKSVSEVLTEQTLGRGLRLPWNAYTDVELLDTVEVLAHESYEKLLREADVLLEGLVDSRSTRPVAAPRAPSAGAPGSSTASPTVASAVSVETGADGETSVVSITIDTTAQAQNGESGAAGATLPAGSVGFIMTTTEDRTATAATEAKAVTTVHAAVALTMPKVDRVSAGRSFQMSSVKDAGPFKQLGQALAAAGATNLTRKKFVVEVSGNADEDGYKLTFTEAAEEIAAAPAQLPLGGAKGALAKSIGALNFVPSATKADLTAINRIAGWVVEGAGSEEALASYLDAAAKAVSEILRREYNKTPESIELVVTSSTFEPSRVNARKIESNRFGAFSPKVAYSGWSDTALYGLNWFDSEPERRFANVINDEKNVTRWARIQRSDGFVVAWNGGRYHPDFYVEFNGVHYLVEVKADKDMQTDDVQAKKDAAETWAQFVTDSGQHGEWRYVLVSESVLDIAKTLDAIISQATVA